jgi:hypothetical protein
LSKCSYWLPPPGQLDTSTARARDITCRSRNRGDLDAEQLAEATVRLGFANVIDAFHVSRGGQPTQTCFFVDERASRQGITLTDHLLELANGQQARSCRSRSTPVETSSKCPGACASAPAWCRSK